MQRGKESFVCVIKNSLNNILKAARHSPCEATQHTDQPHSWVFWLLHCLKVGSPLQAGPLDVGLLWMSEGALSLWFLGPVLGVPASLSGLSPP